MTTTAAAVVLEEEDTILLPNRDTVLLPSRDTVILHRASPCTIRLRRDTRNHHLSRDTSKDRIEEAWVGVESVLESWLRWRVAAVWT